MLASTLLFLEIIVCMAVVGCTKRYRGMFRGQRKEDESRSFALSFATSFVFHRTAIASDISAFVESAITMHVERTTWLRTPPLLLWLWLSSSSSPPPSKRSDLLLFSVCQTRQKGMDMSCAIDRKRCINKVTQIHTLYDCVVVVVVEYTLTTTIVATNSRRNANCSGANKIAQTLKQCVSFLHVEIEATREPSPEAVSQHGQATTRENS